jgi:DNA-binding NtrC family response regulator
MMTEAKINVLLIEDEDFDVRRVRNTIKLFAHRIVIHDVVSSGRAALDLLQTSSSVYDVVIMDFQIAGGLMGENLVREIKRVDPSLQIIVITKMTLNIADYDFAHGLMMAGAFWYCTKYPGDIEEYIYQPTDFILSIVNAYEKKLLERERLTSKGKLIRNVQEILTQRAIIGESTAIKKLREQIEKCASSDAPVLISGSSGTGKEIVAYNIHYTGHRKLENFVPINCGSIPHDLIESELFGYEKGAFTGAEERKLGLFEVADHGTLFLDEVGELPLPAQVKLLRVLQDGEIEKIGRTATKIKVDVRVVAATNKILEEEIEAKRFREDLYYRLNVVQIYLPPLRERTEDIPALFDYYLTQFSADMGKQKPTIDDEAMTVLLSHEWRGNVRELKNVIHRLLFADEPKITRSVFTTALGALWKPMENTIEELNDPTHILPWRQMERKMRETYFRYVRKRSTSDADAAKKLGLAPPNYHRMVKELGIKG